MSIISRVKNWVSGDTLTAADLNAEFNNVLNDYNGGITDANVASNAAISSSKLASTLSGKTLTTAILTKPTINGSIQGLTTDSDGSTITFDMTSSNVHSVVLGGARTLAVSNVSVGQAFVIRLVQDGAGSRTVTWFSTIKWPNGISPTLTTTISKTDVFGFICTSSGNYDGYIVAQAL